ncbi:MAG: tol-pal system-associated acyl-CoA thioesterase [Rhodospirillaceae bacterium]|nr:MAG: tol-pal system-associated acyl-CoA thioesterase [Rhodospirillaceae bacterium]
MNLKNGEFVLPVRIYYEDTDAGGVVYYANYLKFAERARTEMLRELGIENSNLQDCHGIAFVVRKIEVEYLHPARLDDVLEVGVVLTKVGGASIEGLQIVRRDGEDLVRIKVRLGCMKLEGGPGRLPADIRKILQDVETKVEE